MSKLFRSMKKIDSNDYGFKVILAGLIFLVGIPLLGKIILMIFDQEWLSGVIKISIFLGMIILVGFSLWLWLELRQDKYLEHFYEDQKQVRIKMENGNFECQNCGNKGIKEADKQCLVCGITFQTEPENKIPKYRKVRKL